MIIIFLLHRLSIAKDFFLPQSLDIYKVNETAMKISQNSINKNKKRVFIIVNLVNLINRYFVKKIKNVNCFCNME